LNLTDTKKRKQNNKKHYQMFQIKYLEDKSVEKESNKGEKERKKWKDNVIFISWIRFMFPLD